MNAAVNGEPLASGAILPPVTKEVEERMLRCEEGVLEGGDYILAASPAAQTVAQLVVRTKSEEFPELGVQHQSLQEVQCSPSIQSQPQHKQKKFQSQHRQHEHRLQQKQLKGAGGPQIEEAEILLPQSSVSGLDRAPQIVASGEFAGSLSLSALENSLGVGGGGGGASHGLVNRNTSLSHSSHSGGGNTDVSLFFSQGGGPNPEEYSETETTAMYARTKANSPSALPGVIGATPPHHRVSALTPQQAAASTGNKNGLPPIVHQSSQVVKKASSPVISTPLVVAATPTKQTATTPSTKAFEKSKGKGYSGDLPPPSPNAVLHLIKEQKQRHGALVEQRKHVISAQGRRLSDKRQQHLAPEDGVGVGDMAPEDKIILSTPMTWEGSSHAFGPIVSAKTVVGAEKGQAGKRKSMKKQQGGGGTVEAKHGVEGTQRLPVNSGGKDHPTSAKPAAVDSVAPISPLAIPANKLGNSNPPTKNSKVVHPTTHAPPPPTPRDPTSNDSDTLYATLVKLKGLGLLQKGSAAELTLMKLEAPTH